LDIESRRASIGTGLRVIWDGSPVGFVVHGTVAALRGLVPAAVAVLAGRAVAAVPGAIRAGGLHGTGRRLAVVLLAIVALYAADQVVDSFTFALEEGWAMRLFATVEQRTMRALLAPPLLDHLLDADVQRLADLAGRQEWPNIAPFSTACLRAITWLVGGLAQGVLVFRFSPLLAVAATGGWIAVGQWLQHRELVALIGGWERVRRPQYFRRLALEHRSAGEVRVFRLGGWLIGRFDKGWRAAMAQVWRERAATGRRLVGLIAILVAGNLVGIAFVARAALNGSLSPSRAAVVATALVGLTQLALPQHWTEGWLRGASRLPSLLELERVTSRERARVTPREAVPVDGRPLETVRFEDVTFFYPGRTAPVLDRVNLEIPAGRSLGIVGLNGAGKTTLVKLLARLHDPTSGRITVDRIDLRDFDPVAWQRRVAAIFQEFIRYPLTAADNVTLGGLREPVDDGALDEAARTSGAADLVRELSKGWGTVLSRRYSGGTDLSGGLWQRIALARAVHAIRAGAGVLILDEPTANLDVKGEAELFDRFLEVASGATTVLISHRFSTVRRADRIVVLEAGRITEDGTHDSLLVEGGRYAELFDLQAGRYRDRTPR
jgi:ATP-binding cassette subfamily B protein